MQSNPRRAIHQLPTNGGIDSFVHAGNSVVFDHVGEKSGEAWYGLAGVELSVELHADFGKVHGVDYDGGEGGGGATADEGFGYLGEGFGFWHGG